MRNIKFISFAQLANLILYSNNTTTTYNRRYIKKKEQSVLNNEVSDSKATRDRF